MSRLWEEHKFWAHALYQHFVKGLPCAKLFTACCDFIFMIYLPSQQVLTGQKQPAQHRTGLCSAQFSYSVWSNRSCSSHSITGLIFSLQEHCLNTKTGHKAFQLSQTLLINICKLHKQTTREKNNPLPCTHQYIQQQASVCTHTHTLFYCLLFHQKKQKKGGKILEN